VHLQTRLIRPSKWISELHDLSLQVHLHTRSIMASKCISEFTRSWPPSASLTSTDNGLQVRTIMASKCISKLAGLRPPSASLSWTWSRPPSTSPKSLNHGLQVYLWVQLDLRLQVHLWVTRSRPSIASPNPQEHALQVHLWVQLDLGLQVYLHTSSITVSKYVSQFTLSRPPSESLSSLNQRLQVLLRLRSSTICHQIGRMYIYRET